MRIRRLMTAAAIALGVCAGSLALSGAQALAAPTHPLLSEFGSFPESAAHVSAAVTAAVNQADGNVYVPYPGGGLVDVFGAEGKAPVDGLPATLTDPLIEGGFSSHFELNNETGAAVDDACTLEKLSGAACTAFDPSNGRIYFSNFEGSPYRWVVDVFSASNNEFRYICQFRGYTEKGGRACYPEALREEPSPEHELTPTGTAVDRKGDLYVASGGSVYEYNSAGEDLMQFEAESLLGGGPEWVGVDGKGDLYVNAYNGKLIELKRSSFTGAVESSKEIAALATGFAVDQATGSVVVDEGPAVVEYNEAGAVVSKFGEGVLSEGKGVAINETTGAVYVMDIGTATAREFGPLGQYAIPVTGPPSSEQGVSATVTGSIDPESATLGASCNVLYGLTEGYGSTAPCSPQSIPAGLSKVSITADLVGLEGNATYHYRVTATNATGVNIGTDQTFKTLPEKPGVLGELAVPTSPSEAVLAATVAPENEATTYHFVYGTTPVYGLSFPVDDLSLASSSEPTLASLSVGELQPGTTYHYAVVATNGTGSRVGPDQTFTTPPAPPPIVVTGGASEVAQNTATISGTVDPLGVQSTYEFDLGTDTDYGARIIADAGSGAGPETFTLGLRNLAPGTLYHYRVVATNVYGTIYGADQTFTTSTFPTSLLAAPGSEPLVSTPMLVAPSTAGAIEPNPAAKRKTKTKKKKAKAKVKKKRHKAKKASRAAHGNGRSK